MVEKLVVRLRYARDNVIHALMTLHGHVQNGIIVFDDPVTLPEGAAVEVQIVVPSNLPKLDHTQDAELAERLKDFIGVLDLPEDAARNHDHYLYGSPKKQ